MVELTRVTTADIIRRMPEIAPWDGNLLTNRSIDLLICCVGFEDRSTAIIDALDDVNVRSVIRLRYPTNPNDNARAEAQFRSQARWQEQVDLVYERGSFVGSMTRCLNAWKTQPSPRVAIDISGMASYLTYPVLNTVWEQLPGAKLAIFYAEAAEYAPSRSEWDAFFSSVGDANDNLAMAERYEETHFQSRGVDFTYESDIFPGCNVGPLATLVVAIPSFSLQRIKAMVAHAETRYNVAASDIRWFLGQPPDRDRNGWRFSAMAALYNVRDHGVGVSTFDFRETLQRLDALWEEKFTDRHLVIANLGSKMQHLGSFLFLRMHKECGLLLCEPQEFIAGNYTKGIGPKWWIDFGRVGEIEASLQSRGETQFSWD